MLTVEMEPVQESNIQRDKRIEALLRAHRTIDIQIRIYQRRANGDDLLHEPRVTAKPPEEDDHEVMWRLNTEPLTPALVNLADTVRRYLAVEDVKGYATAERVARRLELISPADRLDKDTLKSIVGLLRERKQGEYVDLTPTERIAIIRAYEIERARKKLQILQYQKKVVGEALELTRQLSELQYMLLWMRYVEDKPTDEVKAVLGGRAPLTRHEYLGLRKRAMNTFAQCLPSHMLM
ncbi:MAG: hypothetical protein K6T83_06740 [Alicyclobacillus sp.]|nr:hypothetical protein [Alicyclobacillus sp.]